MTFVLLRTIRPHAAGQAGVERPLGRRIDDTCTVRSAGQATAVASIDSATTTRRSGVRTRAGTGGRLENDCRAPCSAVARRRYGSLGTGTRVDGGLDERRGPGRRGSTARA